METGSIRPTRGDEGRSLDAIMSTMCKSRNLDSSVDRVADPPPELYPILFAVKMECETHSLNLPSCFWEAGAKANGEIPPAKFYATLKDYIRQLHFSKETVDLIDAHYGVHFLAVRNEHEGVAWKDFCADVQRVAKAGEGDFQLLSE